MSRNAPFFAMVNMRLQAPFIDKNLLTFSEKGGLTKSRTVFLRNLDDGFADDGCGFISGERLF